MTVFRNALDFMERLGVYDVLLPFLLVFALIFAILEKTKILGTESLGDMKNVPRRNINSLVAFCVAFFVVASQQLVATINQALANVALLLVLIVSFLMLVGAFHKQGEFSLEDYKGWKTVFMVLVFIAILLIFANAIKTPTGVSWLEWLYSYVITNASGTVVGTIVFLIIIIGGMFLLVRGPPSGDGDD